MNSGKADNTENEKKFHEFETKLKSLVDKGKYSEAMDFYEKNSSIRYNMSGDSCTFYSFKIMGVCYLKDTQKTWYENGYKPSQSMAEGDRLFDAGDYKGAIDAYIWAIDTDSDKAYYARGCAHRAMGNPYESVEDWGTAAEILAKDRNADKLESDPNDAQAWAERGNIDYHLEKYTSALRSYDNSLAIDPDQPEIWFRKGCSHFDKDELTETLAAFKKVLDLKPDHYRAANNTAYVLWKLGQYEQVLELLDQALHNCPREAYEYRSIEINREKTLVNDRNSDLHTFFC